MDLPVVDRTDEMALDRVKAIVKRVKIGHPFSCWDINLLVMTADPDWTPKGHLHVRIRLEVNKSPERDSGIPTKLWYIHRNVPLNQLDSEINVLQMVRCALKAFVLHEVDEAVMVDEVRPFDPHEVRDWKDEPNPLLQCGKDP